MAKSSSYPVVRAKRRKSRSEEREDDQDDGNQRQTTRWWTAKDGMDAASRLWSWIDRLRPLLVADCYDDLIHEAIYEGRPLVSIGEARGLAQLRVRRSATASLNITRSMVDTATARLTKRRPMPVIGADDAEWSEKLFAKKVSRVLRRKMGSTHVESISPAILRDMIIRGDGVAKVCRYGGDLQIDRIPMFEIVYDPREAYYGVPRVIAHHRPVARDVLIEEFPEYEEDIENAATFRRSDQWMLHAYSGQSFADHVEVAESWHLPSGPEATDGQVMLAIRGRALYRGPWIRPRFPIVRFQWAQAVRGWMRGHGLVEDLAGIQAKVDDILRDIQEALYWGGGLKVFTPRGSNVNKQHLRARHPIVVEHDGAIPQFVAPSPVSQQSLGILEMLIQKAYEISGISQMSANSKNILGSNASGKAIDTMDDIQSDRFAHVEAGYQQGRVLLGMVLVDEARAMYMEATGKLENPFEESGDALTKEDLAPWIAEHDWERVDVDSGTYHLALEPINFLPDTRSGKLSFVAELSKAGLIPDPTMTADLFDEPDIARANRTILGPKHRIDQVMEGLADPEVEMMDLMPDVHMNLELAVLIGKGELNDAQANGAPEEVLERYRAFLKACKVEIDNAAKGVGGAPSLPGMQATNMGASPNAATLQPDLAGGPAMEAPMPVEPGMMPPSGMMQ